MRRPAIRPTNPLPARRHGVPLVLAVLLSLLPWICPGAAPPSEEVRAIWVVRTTLTSPASIAAMVESARSSGFNTLLVQIRGRGDAFYRSSIEPRANALSAQPDSFDPLGLTIRLAHHAGIQVHAWFNVNLVADVNDLPVSRRHLIYRHPEWLMLPRELAGALGRMDPRNPAYLARLATWTRGQNAAVEGLYASPISDRAADHVVGVVSELAARYPIDGLHLDYARYPSRAFDYSRDALAMFQEVVSRDLPRGLKPQLQQDSRRDIYAYVDRFPERWQEFRTLRLTGLVRRVGVALRAKRPTAFLSAAVVPDAAEAASDRFQDWRGWIDQKLLDGVCPMSYTADPSAFRTQIGSVRSAASGLRVWAGIGAYRLTPEQTLTNISLAREAGADGVALFSYDALVRPPNGIDTLSRIGRAAFGQ